MKHIIEEYGGVILAVIGVMLLVGVIAVVSDKISSGTQNQINKMEEKINSDTTDDEVEGTSTGFNTNDNITSFEAAVCSSSLDDSNNISILGTLNKDECTYNKGAYAPFVV